MPYPSFSYDFPPDFYFCLNKKSSSSRASMNFISFYIKIFLTFAFYVTAFITLSKKALALCLLNYVYTLIIIEKDFNFSVYMSFYIIYML